MKKIFYFLTMCSTLILVSCSNDILDRTPLDEISEPEFWKTTSDLELYANSFYNKLPGWSGVGFGSAQMPDVGTDLGLGTGVSSRLDGSQGIPNSNSNSLWSWDEVRQANYFVSNMDKAVGLEVEVNQYKGEGYFFRAYFYYDLFKKYGDLPIYDAYFDNLNTDELYKARSPRNEVADFILADLDKAIALLKPKGDLAMPRINKEAAQLFKATIALYEGTWEKYHNGTAFGVAGSDGTVYLQQAADAAKALIDGGTRALNPSYGGMFNQTNLSTNSEIILWKEYDFASLGNSFGNDAQVTWPNNFSYSLESIRSYLALDGLPTAVSTLTTDDKELANIETNRDPRLAETLMVPGDVTVINVDGSMLFWEEPTVGQSVGAYESQKYRITTLDPSTNNYSRNTAKIIMRYGEALLIYAEAKAELGTITQADLDISINKLRERAGFDFVANPTAKLTLAPVTDPNWPDYGHNISSVLQEIRRERAVELMNEGFRLDDLMRWGAHKLFVAKRPKGAYYETLIVDVAPNLDSDADGYLDPYAIELADGYGFNPDRDYLLAIPAEELVLNPNLEPQNPGW
ncbi:RagB/SusD family nutrient uptake outer membrane protein [Mariniflexile sp. AS56]|uniref:RagB/SusD family nutrient uptake outer membrane protein n=1 Tax=Mariniflexile sp. AS56 TaxID=3063957 RepID=UPI0026EF0CA9|nr:RagB/SusD family nutrient uptake outer membrane protein [Mariniflexile sp. AS56]MDO7172660.1 RagB/SusD family nutrient uptake outer membrane protein [Mariniflexile sp. AS56]